VWKEQLPKRKAVGERGKKFCHANRTKVTEEGTYDPDRGLPLQKGTRGIYRPDAPEMSNPGDTRMTTEQSERKIYAHAKKRGRKKIVIMNR